MNVLFYMYNVGGGAGINMLRVYKHLIGKSNVDFLCSRNSYPHNIGIQESNVSSGRLALLLLKKLVFKKYDLVFSSVLQNNLVAAFLCLFFDAKHYIRETGVLTAYLSEQSRFKRYVYSFFIKLLYKKATKIIVISTDIKNDLISNFNIEEAIITVIYNPAKVEDSKQNFLDFKYKKYKYLLGVGRLEPEKNWDDLILAFSEVQDTYELLILVGEGNCYNKLVGLVNDLGLNDKVIFEGFVTNPSPYFIYADTFILPSSREGFGNVIVEALSFGCNVIATRCPGGPKEILDEGKFGALYTPKDVDSLIKILKTKDWRLSKEALIERSDDFSLTLILKSYQNVLFNEI